METMAGPLGGETRSSRRPCRFAPLASSIRLKPRSSPDGVPHGLLVGPTLNVSRCLSLAGARVRHRSPQPACGGRAAQAQAEEAGCFPQLVLHGRQVPGLLRHVRWEGRGLGRGRAGGRAAARLRGSFFSGKTAPQLHPTRLIDILHTVGREFRGLRRRGRPDSALRSGDPGPYTPLRGGWASGAAVLPSPKPGAVVRAAEVAQPLARAANARGVR